MRHVTYERVIQHMNTILDNHETHTDTDTHTHSHETHTDTDTHTHSHSYTYTHTFHAPAYTNIHASPCQSFHRKTLQENYFALMGHFTLSFYIDAK